MLKPSPSGTPSTRISAAVPRSADEGLMTSFPRGVKYQNLLGIWGCYLEFRGIIILFDGKSNHFKPPTK
jgi:hypothetical protein